MKTTLLRLCTGLIAVLLLANCAATPQSRIERNPQLYNQLSTRDRALVARGTIREGMNRDAVYLAWGSPDRVSAGSSKGRKLEAWTYEGQQPVSTFNTGVGWGSGWGPGLGAWGPYWGGGPWGWSRGGYGYWGGGPSVTYVPYTQAVVEFSSGRVSRYLTSPRG